MTPEEQDELRITERAFKLFPVMEDSGEPDEDGYYRTIDTNEKKRDEWIWDQLLNSTQQLSR